jgi:hypothetical protein
MIPVVPSATRSYTLCFSVAAGFFIFSTLISDTIARMTIGGEGFVDAISEHVYYAAVQPLGTALLLAPFLLVAWMAGALIRRRTTRRGIIFLCITCSVLALMYFGAYQNAQDFLAQRMWTAAALTVGLLAFKSIPVLVVALIAFLFSRRGSHVEP